MSDYQPIVRCAACDRDVIERELEAHWATCVAKPAPAVRYFQYAVEGHPIEGRRFVEEVPPPPIEKPAPVTLADTIAARSARYGDFKKQAEIGEAMRAAMRDSPNWDRLSPFMRLALEWITDKISRLLCGDPNYRDNWHDIAGYASLVDRELAAP